MKVTATVNVIQEISSATTTAIVESQSWWEGFISLFNWI
jgi:hypothetical protein